MKNKIETILNEAKYNGLPTHIVAEQLLDLFTVSGIIAEIDNIKRFNIEAVDSDGKRVIEYDKDGMFVDANELDKNILNYR